jgi:hypothetical protein
MCEIQMSLGGYISPLIPFRTYEVVSGGKVIDTFEARGAEDAVRVANTLYPNSNIKFQPRLVDA